jgi:hypothetical protein
MIECKLRSGVNWWGIEHNLCTLCFIYTSHVPKGYPDAPQFHQEVVLPLNWLGLLIYPDTEQTFCFKKTRAWVTTHHQEPILY